MVFSIIMLIKNIFSPLFLPFDVFFCYKTSKGFLLLSTMCRHPFKFREFALSFLYNKSSQQILSAAALKIFMFSSDPYQIIKYFIFMQLFPILISFSIEYLHYILNFFFGLFLI